MANILITGSEGFIGKNLLTHMKYSTNHEVNEFNSNSKMSDLEKLVHKSDFIYHLAGINRSNNINEFSEINYGLTKNIFDFATCKTKKTDIFFSSSTQSDNGSEYGNSKSKAEKLLLSNNNHKGSIYVSRLPNIFW